MNDNVKIARDLIRMAKSLVASDELESFAKEHGVYDLDEKVIKDMDASDASGAEYGDPHTYSLNEMYKMYNDDVESIRHSYPDFGAWLDDVTGKNGRCVWIDAVKTDLYSIDGVDGYDLAEAEEIARSKKGQDIEILSWNCEPWKLCEWCEDIFPESMLKEENNLGLLCEHCVDAIWSRGEELHFVEDED